MTLDCTNLKPGDRVRLRNGEIRTVKENDGTDVPICLDDGNWYYDTGDQGFEDSPRSIIEILPPEPPTDCTSRQQAMAVAEELTARARKQAWAKVEPSVTPSSSLLEVTHDFNGPKHPNAISCNGKLYVPADSPSLFIGQPFSIITHPSEGVVALRYDDKLFTPADAWPEPIKDRAPTEEDADPKGEVQCLTCDGDWCRYPWRAASRPWKFHGWARTSDWKPKPTPAHTREQVLDILRDSKSIAGISMTHAHDDPDLLASIIIHLEASDE